MAAFQNVLCPANLKDGLIHSSKLRIASCFGVNVSIDRTVATGKVKTASVQHWTGVRPISGPKHEMQAVQLSIQKCLTPTACTRRTAATGCCNWQVGFIPANYNVKGFDTRLMQKFAK